MNVTPAYSIKNPFTAKIERVASLNKEGSTKTNYHVEISIEGSGIKYEVGSSFGFLPLNLTEEIDHIMTILATDKNFIVHPAKIDAEISIYDFFLKHVNVSRVTQKIALACLPYQENNHLETLMQEDWKGYCDQHDLVEFLAKFYSKQMPIQELVDVLSPMLPRFYSIASSQKVLGNRLLFLVADFSYKKGNKNYTSITASHLLKYKTIRIFPQPNPSFCPPREDVPIIMVGPGTGLAAFLGFLQEQIVHNQRKNNVLFTGDRNEKVDFYYEDELKQYQKSGHLQLFTAFSRDSSRKIYVQDRMWEERALLYDLIIFQKAHIYISGDADRMAKDVILMLEKILTTHSSEEAHLAVRELKKQKRLHMDVY